MPTKVGGPGQSSRIELKGAHILVVEDQWHVAIALKSLLETEGMEVIGPAATTADALRLVNVKKPALAVVDLNLKGNMAHGLIDQLHDQGVRIIVATGYA